MMSKAAHKQDHITKTKHDVEMGSPNQVEKVKLDSEYVQALKKDIQANKEMYIQEADEAVEQYLAKKGMKK